ncbi:hypothetical protein K270103H11_17810 [Gordonibacter urolithinfaciens]
MTRRLVSRVNPPLSQTFDGHVKHAHLPLLLSAYCMALLRTPHPEEGLFAQTGCVSDILWE